MAAWVLVVLPGIARAEVPSGPRLTFTRATDSKFELISADPAGQDQQVILGEGRRAQHLVNPFSAPAWSADGSRMFFSGLFKAPEAVKTQIYEAAADGSGAAALPRSIEGIFPVFSPDGHTLAYAVRRRRVSPRGGPASIFRSVSTWLLDVGSGKVKQLTPWRNNLYVYPSSFSPDGSILALSRGSDRNGVFHDSVVALHLDGSGAGVLADNAGEAVYSPDGSKVALIVIGRRSTYKLSQGSTDVTPTDIAVANADGSGLKKLTQTKALEVGPSWDPSGQRLAYTQFRASASEADFLGIGDSIMEINADGSCRTRVLSYGGAILYGATWQPGPGREAGPIAC